MNPISIPWDSQAAWPLLAVLQLLPLLGALVVLALRRGFLATFAGVILASFELLLAILLYRGYDPTNAAMQFAEHLSLPGLLDYHAAVDGVSILFILLTALIILLVSLYGPVRGLGPPSRLMALILAIESSLMLMFTTLNLLWFVLAAALQTGLIGLLLKLWATSPRMDQAIKTYIKFMGTGLSLLLVRAPHPGLGPCSRRRRRLDLRSPGASRGPGGVRIPDPGLFPAVLRAGHPHPPLSHARLAASSGRARQHRRGPDPAPGTQDRHLWLAPLRPAPGTRGGAVWQPFVVAFAVVGIFYAALLAMVQENLRRLLAFAVVSHTSLIVLGLFHPGSSAFQGSVMLAVTFGLAVAALLFMTGLVYRRTKTTQLAELGGLFDQIPLVGIAFLVGGLSIIGMPGTPGFDAAHLVLEAAIARFGGLLTIAAALGNLLAAGLLLWAFQRAFLGPCPEGQAPVERLGLAEWLVSGAIIAVLLGVGFSPIPGWN